MADTTGQSPKLETRTFRTLTPEALSAVAKVCPSEASRVVREIVHRLSDCHEILRSHDDSTEEHMMAVIEEGRLYSTLGKTVFTFWNGLTVTERLIIGHNAMTGREKRSLLEILVQFSTVDFDDEVGDMKEVSGNA